MYIKLITIKLFYVQPSRTVYAKEEDATVWARYSSAYFEQGAGRQACNNPYDQKLDESMYQEMQRSKIFEVEHKLFLDLIHPSFEGVDNMEDMAAIIARTHIIVITDNGVYWRLAGAQKSKVKFVPWPAGEPIDILAPSQKPVFAAYKKNPSNHTLPPNFHADMVWSHEVLGRLFRGEHVPRTMTVRGCSLFGGEPSLPRQIPPRLLDDGQTKAKVKKEQVSTVFRNLKRTGPIQIELDSPSPPSKQQRNVASRGPSSMPSSTARASSDDLKNGIPNPEFANPNFGDVSADEDVIPAVGERPDDDMNIPSRPKDDLERDLETLVDEEIARENAVSSDVSGGTLENDMFRNVCGIKILHWFGLPVPVSDHGPHRVSELNDMIKKFHVQFVPVVSTHVGVDGMYLCHQHGHFTGIWCREGFIRHSDNGNEHVMSMSGLTELVESPAVCIFRLLQRSHVELNTLFDAIGGSGGVFKRPASRDPIPVLTCPLVRCVAPGCKGSLIIKHNIEAVCYDMTGPRDIMYQSKECTSRNCRANYSYNFRWSEGQKINVLGYDDLADEVLFVNAKKCFALSFLKYHEELLFRGQISTRAIEHAYKTLHTDEDTDGRIIVDFRKCYQSALFYFIALREFENLGLHMSLVIDDEINDANLEVYNAFCHSSIFPPSKRASVKCLVGDGHLNLKPRCADGPIKRAGRPRTKSKARN